MDEIRYFAKIVIGLVAVWLIVLLSGNACLFGQRTVANFDQIKQVTESGASPIKASLSCSLDSPVNLLTGAASFDIPIYTINTGGYSLPISLHYETSGFKVSDMASEIGMGWSLNAGGCITRTIKGFLDETNDVGYCAQGHVADSIREYVLGLTYTDYLGDSLENDWETSLFATLLEITDNLIDAEPDIYSFSFAGYSGNFIFDHQGGIHLIPEQNFDIERTEFGFIITVDNGDRYYFGESNAKESISKMKNVPLCMKVSEFERNIYLENLRYRHLYSTNILYDDWDKNYADAWFLTKIEPKGTNRSINLSYDCDEIKVYIGTDETYMYGQGYNQIRQTSPSGEWDWVLYRINRFKFANVPRLRRISWDNGTIDFIPSTEYREDLNYEENPNPRTYGGHSIEQIRISSAVDEGNLQNYSIDLKHSYFKDHHAVEPALIEWKSYFKRLRLDGIQFNGIEECPIQNYSFTYNQVSSMHCRSRNTCEADRWGYLKPRGDDPTSFIKMAIKPTIYYYENGKDNPLYNTVYSVWRRYGEPPTQILNGYSDMEPELAGSKEFTLRDVTLPTGGIITFNYELNDFHFDNQDIKGPGVRVKSVHYGIQSSSGNSYDKEYNYKIAGHSAGKVSRIPNIGIQNPTPKIAGFQNLSKDQLTSRQVSTVSDMRGTSESIVQYERITESVSNSNASLGKTVYYNHLTMTAEDESLNVGDEVFVAKTQCKRSSLYQAPDVPSLHNPIFAITHEDSSPDFTYPITSWYNGFLTKKELFNSSNQLVESYEYKYQLKPSDDAIFYIQSKFFGKYATLWEIYDYNNSQNYQMSVHQYDILWGVNYYKTGVRQLDTIIHKTYDQDNVDLVNTTTKVFNYNDFNYVRSEATELSDGSISQTTYSYPFDFNTTYPETQVFRTMLQSNMLSQTVEQYSSIDGRVTDGQFYSYAAIGERPYLKPVKTFSLRTDAPLSDFTPSSILAPDIDSRYELTNEIKYDSGSGDIIEIWDENDGRTVIVWGFNYGVVLAKVKNANAVDVENALPCSLSELQTKMDDNELISIFQTLRSALPQSMVTSFTYDPFLKLTSITDASGKTSRFEYDSALRLKLTRDVQNNIIQKYDYHYKQ